MRNVALAAGVVVGLGVLGYLAARRAGELVAANSHLVNPTDPRNVVYQGANEVGAVITGDSSFSLGGWLYDVFNPEVSAQIQALQAGTTPEPSYSGIGYTEPALEQYQDPLNLSP